MTIAVSYSTLILVIHRPSNSTLHLTCGYRSKHVALLGAHRYDEAIETFKTMISKFENAPGTQTQSTPQITTCLNMLDSPQSCANNTLIPQKQKELFKRRSRLNSTTPRIICLIPLLGAYAIEQYRSMPSKRARSTRSFCH